MKTAKNRLRLLSLAILALAGIQLGCAVIQSSRHTGFNTDSGLAYCLPKGLLQVSIIETITTVATSNSSSNAPAAAVNPSTTNCSVSVGVSLVADRERLYILKMKPSWLADDYMKIAVSNSLLETLTLSNSDQSLGAINNLALAAINAFKFAATAADATRTITNIYLIDPFSPNRDAFVGQIRAEYGVNLHLDDFPTNTVPGTTNAVKTDGIFYRPLQAYQFSWDSSGGSGAGSLYFPNGSPILSLDIERAAFVTQTALLSIQDGIPTEMDLNKPSQVLAVSTLPLNIAQSLVGLPTNLLQLKINYDSAANQLLAAQSANLTNLMIESAAQKMYNQWLATNSPAKSNPVGGGGRGGNAN